MRRFRLTSVIAISFAALVVRAQQTGEPHACLMGQVVADDDKGVAGASVKLYREGSTAEIPLAADSAGRFTFTNCAAGWYGLTAVHPDYPQQVYGATEPGGLGTPLVLGGEPLSGLKVRLLSAGVVLGTVRKVSGEPLGGVQVSVEALTIDSTGAATRSIVPSASSVATDAQGQYRVAALPPGRYVIRASPPRAPISSTDPPEGFVSTYYPSAARADQGAWIDVGGNQTLAGIDILVKTARYVRVNGRVLDATGSSIENGTVWVEESEGRVPTTSLRVNAGRFSVPSIPAGQYLLHLREAGVADRPVRAFALVDLNGAESTVDTELVVRQSSSLTGTLAIRSTEARAPSGFRVTLAPRDPRLRGMAFGVPVRADGSFSIEGIPPGEHRLSMTGASPSAGTTYRLVSARVGDQETVDGFFEVGGGATLSAALVASETPGQITGTLTHSNGGPATEYTVVVFPANKAQWSAWLRRSFGVRPANTGEFRIPNVPAGDYRVAVVEKARRNEWLVPEFLESLVGASTPVSVVDKMPTAPVRLMVK